MCPSYMATRDENDSTRGRANVLRLALSGQLAGEDLAGDAVAEALGLCVSCKGCKRDCPTGVDIARVKIEVLHADRRKRGLSERDRVIAELPERAYRASRWPLVPAVLNRLAQTERGRAWGEQRYGISTRRSLPRLRRDTLWRRASSLKLATREEVLGAEKGVVLFVDSFNGLFESENAVAAVRVMQAAGYAVHVPTTPDRTPRSLKKASARKANSSGASGPLIGAATTSMTSRPPLKLPSPSRSFTAPSSVYATSCPGP